MRLLGSLPREASGPWAGKSDGTRSAGRGPRRRDDAEGLLLAPARGLSCCRGRPQDSPCGGAPSLGGRRCHPQPAQRRPWLECSQPQWLWTRAWGDEEPGGRGWNRRHQGFYPTPCPLWKGRKMEVLRGHQANLNMGPGDSAFRRLGRHRKGWGGVPGTSTRQEVMEGPS